MQLALNVQIPEPLGGAEGEAVYIDTEGSFTALRTAEMAKYLSDHLHRISRSIAKSHSAPEIVLSSAQKISVESLLGGIHVYRVHDQTELMAVLHQLSGFIAQHARVKLVVIDSIAFPFRQDVQETSVRNRVLSGIAQLLNQLAYEHRLAVVLTNHVTTRVNAVGSGRVLPALGEHWSHCVTNRVLLEWAAGRQGSRIATLVKSPSRPVAGAEYAVVAAGVRDHVRAANS